MQAKRLKRTTPPPDQDVVLRLLLHAQDRQIVNINLILNIRKQCVFRPKTEWSCGQLTTILKPCPDRNQKTIGRRRSTATGTCHGVQANRLLLNRPKRSRRGRNQLCRFPGVSGSSTSEEIYIYLLLHRVWPCDCIITIFIAVCGPVFGDLRR